MSDWLKFNAKLGDEMATIAINFTHVQSLKIHRNVLYVDLPDKQGFSIGQAGTSAGYVVDAETMNRITDWFSKRNIIG